MSWWIYVVLVIAAVAAVGVGAVILKSRRAGEATTLPGPVPVEIPDGRGPCMDCGRVVALCQTCKGGPPSCEACRVAAASCKTCGGARHAPDDLPEEGYPAFLALEAVFHDSGLFLAFLEGFGSQPGGWAAIDEIFARKTFTDADGRRFVFRREYTGETARPKDGQKEDLLARPDLIPQQAASGGDSA